MPTETVQILTVADEAVSPSFEDLLALLDESEVVRAQRLFGSRSNAQFVTARAASRVILGRLLEVAPRDVPITTGKYGKPTLASNTLGFSISHTKGLILVAVREAGPVGIDVEMVQRRRSRSDLQQRILAESELQAFETLPPGTRRRAFLQAWSRKEAYAKGVGLGLGLNFRTIDVGWDGSAIIGDPAWEVRSLPVPHPHIGAVAAQGSGWLMKIGTHSW